MKQITLDFETYSYEIERAQDQGYDICIKELLSIFRDVTSGDTCALDEYSKKAEGDPTRNAQMLCEHIKLLADLKYLKENDNE